MRLFCKSKIHRARVVGKSLNYGGSVAIGTELMRAAEIMEGEIVQVVNLTTGARWHTYVIEDNKNPHNLSLNGGGARLGEIGDEVFILSYEILDLNELKERKIKVVYVSKDNKVLSIKNEENDWIELKTKL